MTPADVIVEARKMIGDTRAPYRNSDTVLLGFVNQAVKRTALLRPDLFSTFADLICVAGEVRQSAAADSIRLMEVLQIKSGGALTETSREAMDQNWPSWTSDTAAVATTWMRHPRDPNKFFIYPKAPAVQTLVVEYAQSPAISSSTADNIPNLPDVYLPCLVDCVVFLVEMQNDSSVLSKRAELFYKMFTDGLGVTVQSKSVTDTESGAAPQRGG